MEEKGLPEMRAAALVPLSQVLKEAVDSAASRPLNLAQTSPVTETTVEGCLCRTCGATFQGEVTVFKRLIPPREVRARECPQCTAKRVVIEEREHLEDLEGQRKQLRGKWRRESGMPPELLTRTFANFEPQYQKAAWKAAVAWARDFDFDAPRGYPSLMFYSAIPGVGKGHLMAAIVNYVLDNWKGDPERVRCPVRFESGPSLVRRIRATYNLRKEDFTHEREDEVYHALAGVPLLLLDDVGKEKPSDFTRETYWFIINERVTTGLPVIISSRLEFEGEHSLETLMHEDTVSRLYGMTRGQFVKMKGQDYRKLKGVA